MKWNEFRFYVNVINTKYAQTEVIDPREILFLKKIDKNGINMINYFKFNQSLYIFHYN